MAHGSKRKEDDSVYNRVGENSLYNVLNDLYQTDKGSYKTVTDTKQQDFNKIVWASEEKSSNT